MTFSLTVFLVSGFGLISWLSLKANALSGSKISSNFMQRADLLVEAFYKKIEFRIKTFNLKTILAQTGIFVIHVIREFLDLLKIWIESLQVRFDKIVAMINGRRAVNRSMASSVYLKNIKAYKDEIKAGQDAGRTTDF